MSWHSKDGRSGTLAYDKKSYRDWRAYARGMAADQYKGPIIEGPVKVRVDIYRQIPASFSDKKKRQAVAGVLRPLVKPDCSNYLKAVEDACLTGIVIRDDRCIVSVHVAKWYSDEPRVEISIEAVEERAVKPLPVETVPLFAPRRD